MFANSALGLYETGLFGLHYSRISLKNCYLSTDDGWSFNSKLKCKYINYSISDFCASSIAVSFEGQKFPISLQQILKLIWISKHLCVWWQPQKKNWDEMCWIGYETQFCDNGNDFIHRQLLKIFKQNSAILPRNGSPCIGSLNW